MDDNDAWINIFGFLMLQNPPISIDEVCLGVSMQTMYH